ncbi:MAG: flagellar basal body L-ring protein FlgH [Pseudomonadota bacterium]
MKTVAVLALGVVLAGCSSPGSVKPDPNFTTAYPVVTKPIPNSNGAIYQDGYNMSLFEDSKARHIGDIILVTLVENTNASKSASTTTSKESSMELGAPTLFGGGVTHNGVPILSGSVEAAKNFDGAGDSKQSNSLSGTIAVTVSEVLPNGYLVVRGEKVISLNQGDEYVRFSGIIRPQDISARNTVLSSQVANAQIIYGGEGVIASANSMGWLERFFQSSWWPF